MTRDQILERLTAIRDDLTSLLLDIVPDDIPWEDVEPEIDAAREELNCRIEQLEK